MTITRPSKGPDGFYRIKGARYEKLLGTRAEVWHGTAYKTAGYLTKDALFFHEKSGRIVSKSKHYTAKKEDRLVAHGFGAKKGKFGTVKLRRSTRKRQFLSGGNS